MILSLTSVFSFDPISCSYKFHETAVSTLPSERKKKKEVCHSYNFLPEKNLCKTNRLTKYTCNISHRNENIF